MAITQKDEMSENVRQKHRLGVGAWINGSELKEQATATMPKANSDHGNFEKSSIEKRNA
jgi:hypothetical protein